MCNTSDTPMQAHMVSRTMSNLKLRAGRERSETRADPKNTSHCTRDYIIKKVYV